MLQEVAWYGTLIGVAALAAVFLWVARHAGQPGDPERIGAGASRGRRALTWTLGLAFAPITAVSLWAAPIRSEAPAAGERIVEVVGHQWYWEIGATRFSVDEPVIFRVTSADVNHAFAIYDPDMQVIAQTQAMPGYFNGLRVRFPRPGQYKVLCLEYCGLVHHSMLATLDVTASAVAEVR